MAGVWVERPFIQLSDDELEKVPADPKVAQNRKPRVLFARLPTWELRGRHLSEILREQPDAVIIRGHVDRLQIERNSDTQKTFCFFHTGDPKVLLIKFKTFEARFATHFTLATVHDVQANCDHDVGDCYWCSRKNRLDTDEMYTGMDMFKQFHTVVRRCKLNREDLHRLVPKPRVRIVEESNLWLPKALDIITRNKLDILIACGTWKDRDATHKGHWVNKEQVAYVKFERFTASSGTMCTQVISCRVLDLQHPDHKPDECYACRKMKGWKSGGVTLKKDFLLQYHEFVPKHRLFSSELERLIVQGPSKEITPQAEIEREASTSGVEVDSVESVDDLFSIDSRRDLQGHEMLGGAACDDAEVAQIDEALSASLSSIPNKRRRTDSD